MEQYYHRAATIIMQLIPEEWSKVFLYAEIREGMKRVFFYYYPEGSTIPVYSLDIPERFHLDQKQFDDVEYQLYKCFGELWKEFIAQDQELWTQLTYILDRTGELKINYNYEDISQLCPTEKREKWEAEYLGIRR